MSSITLCSDEDIEAIFYHLDFPKKCLFRRCSRRWNRFLRSAVVLHTVAFILPPRETLQLTQKFVQAMQEAVAHMRRLALIAVKDQRLSVRQWLKWEVLRTLPAGSPHQERRLYFCDFDEFFHTFQQSLYDTAAFDWIELCNVRLVGTEVRAILLDAAQDSENLQDQETCHPLRLCYADGVSSLAFELTGRHVVKSPLPETGRDSGLNSEARGVTKVLSAALVGLIREHVLHLTEEETSEMLERMPLSDEDRVQAAFIWLLKVYVQKATLDF